MQKLKDLLGALAHNELVMRVVHTAWQAAGSALLVSLLAARSSTDVKAALIAAGATALAAAKALVVAPRG